MPRWIPLWWLGLCLAVGGTAAPLRAGGPCTSAPPCPETTCPAPPAKIVVEMSPPEVVFQQAPAPAPQACHHGLFHKHCEAPAPAAPAAPPVTTQTATYFFYAPPPVYAAPMPVAAAPALAMPVAAPAPAFAYAPAALPLVPAAPAAAMPCAPAAAPPCAAPGAGMPWGAPGAQSANPAAALAAQRAYLEAELKSRLDAVRDEERLLSSRLESIAPAAVPPKPGTDRAAPAAAPPATGPDVVKELNALRQDLQDLEKIVLVHHEILKKQGLIPKKPNE